MQPLSQKIYMDFAADFFQKIADINYACLRYLESSIEEYDFKNPFYILINKKNQKRFITALKSIRTVTSISKSEGSGFIQLVVNTSSKLKICIYLIFNLLYDGYLIMNTNELLRQSHPNHEGIRIPDLNHTFEYIFLHYQLRKQNIPEKYAMFFKYLDYQTKDELLEYFNRRYELRISSLSQLVLHNSQLHHIILGRLKRAPRNKFIIRNLYMIIDHILLSYRRGMQSISVS